jgi:hypothetical protein
MTGMFALNQKKQHAEPISQRPAGRDQLSATLFRFVELRLSLFGDSPN